MKNVEKFLNEFSRDITDHYTIVIKWEGEKETKRFTFKDHKINALEKELKKHYGDIIARRLVTKLMRAETHRTLKNFAVDDSVNFIISKDLKSLVKTVFKEDMNEVSAEIAKGKIGLGYVPRKIFDEQKKQIAWDSLQPEWKEVMQEVISVLNKNPKLAAKFAPNTGEVDLHLGKGKNLVFLTADDGTKLKYNVASKRLENA